MAISSALGAEATVDLAQGTIAYRSAGPASGRAVVFLHGLLVNGDLWRGVAPRLGAAGYRSITPDWPLGSHRHPLAENADHTPPGLAKLIVDFLSALDLREPVLVANDTGGALAQIVAANYPERLGTLVLTSCDSFDNFLPALFRPLQWAARVPGSVWLLAQTLRSPTLQRLPIAFGWLTQRPIDPAVMRSYLEPIQSDRRIRRDLARVLGGIDSRFTIEAASNLGRFRAPALVAWGAEDRVFPLDHGRRLAALLGDGRFVSIPGARSFVPEDQPEALATTILDFLAATAPGVRSAASLGR